ncbi:MAG TPA: hypothetical protein VFK52_05720 [Nocardioidaceae bacterium]|nr:hypothetical protein [Nocardioidaceae bacterium]
MPKRTLARAAAALLTPALTLTATTVPADAKPKAGTHAPATSKAPSKADATAKQLVAAKRTTTRSVAVADARLARAASDQRLAALDIETVEILRAGIAADRENLALLGDQVAAATVLSEVRDLARAVQAVRIEVWAIAVDVLSDATTLTAEADEVAAALDLVLDVSLAAYLAVDEALAALDSAVGKALATTAFGGKAELLTAYDDLATATSALAVAGSYLLAPEPAV